MLMIRLKQGGNKTFRIVVAERLTPQQGKHLEIVGQYHPKTKHYQVNHERIDYWVSKGAQMTDTVRQLVERQKASA